MGVDSDIGRMSHGNLLSDRLCRSCDTSIMGEPLKRLEVPKVQELVISSVKRQNEASTNIS